MAIEKYTLKRDMICEQYGKAFLLRKGSECCYFDHTNVYLFEAQEGCVPYFDRATVEMFPQFFRPVKRAQQSVHPTRGSVAQKVSSRSKGSAKAARG